MFRKRERSIHSKGFDLYRDNIAEKYTDPMYADMRVGVRNVKNTLVDMGVYKRLNRNFGDKLFVLRAIERRECDTLRQISRFFYETNGIYKELCQYLATLYKYDWYVTPYINNVNTQSSSKVLRDFSKVLLYLDHSDVKRVCINVASDIIVDGVYYGLLIDFDDRFGLQKLPPEYCRSRYFSGTFPIVELNLQFFDAYFPNPQYKIKILKTFPKEIQQAYALYKQGKLKGDYPGDTTYWVALDPETSIKLSLSDTCYPTLVGVIPSIIDLDEAQELDRKKTMQQLLKIIVQKLPLDKNGDLIFDVDEARDIHNNAVEMLRKAIGVEVLTTFADIDKIDTKDNNSNTSTDDLEKVERTVYNNSGISHNLFNADGNIATTNSILADESKMRVLPLLFAGFLNRAIAKFNRINHYEFRVEILETTQFNYQTLAKIYKEQASLGYQKLLPQIALGHSQSSILATLTFENELLNLVDLMRPPQSSNTISKKDLDTSNQSSTNKKQNKQAEEKQSGRPALEEQEKSDKTIANQESA